MVNSLWFFFKRLDQKVIFRTFSCDDGVFSLFSALCKRGTGFRDLLIDQGRAHVQKGFFGQTIRVTCVVDCQEFICTVTFIWLQDQGEKKSFWNGVTLHVWDYLIIWRRNWFLYIPFYKISFPYIRIVACQEVWKCPFSSTVVMSIMIIHCLLHCFGGLNQTKGSQQSLEIYNCRHITCMKS